MKEVSPPLSPIPPKKRKSHQLVFGLGKEKDYIIENLSLLIGAGLDVLSALTLLKSDVRSKIMRQILDDTIHEIENGSSLSQALDGSRLFPPYMIALIHIGEESGKLIENLKIVALQDERDRAFRSQVRSAMMYPIFVFSFTLIIGTGVAWFILPRLATVFNSLHVKLPWITQVLINSGQWLGKHGAVAVPTLLLSTIALLYLIFFFPTTKFIGQALLFRIPGIKKLLQELELSRFGYLLGTLLSAGIPITTAVNSLVEATFFPAYRKIYLHLQTELEEGVSIQDSLASYPHSNRYIPIPVQGMISAGEQSGTIAETFLHIGQTFSAKTEITTKNLSTLLEPLLLIFVWFGVMGVALAVFLPIYNLIGGFDQQTTPSGVPQKLSTPIRSVTSTTLNNPTHPSSLSSTTTANTLTSTPQTNPTLVVLPTDLGYVNVRDLLSTQTGKIISQVKPGEIYPYEQSQAGWYKIIFTSGTTGWIFGKYAQVK